MTDMPQTISAKAIATQFFDAYRNHQISAMVELFDPAGIVEYVPFNLIGSLEEAGRNTWNTLIYAFTNLTNRVLSICQDETRRIAYADVYIGGTQVKEAFGASNQGKTYDLRHLFIFCINETGKITSLVSFWDNADWYQQLGKTHLN